MENRYVDVAITRETKVITSDGAGVSLVVSLGSMARAVTEYSSLGSIASDYATDTDAYKVAKNVLNHSPKVSKVAILQLAYDEENDTPDTLVRAFNEAVQEYGDFMFTHLASNNDEFIIAFSNDNVGKDRVFVATTSTIATVDALKANDNTFLVIRKEPSDFIASAAIGKVSAYKVGEYTLTFTQLPGFIDDKWTDQELLDIEKGASAYIREGGVNIISKGVTTSGEYVDIIIGQYYLKHRITEAVYNLLVSKKKISFTNRGISLVYAVIDGVLKTNAANGVIAIDDNDNPLYTLEVPDVSEISAADKANRILPDVYFEATIDGAIEKVKIRGLLTL